MNREYYLDIIDKEDDKIIGIAMGSAIKDKDITSDTYLYLCKAAKQKGWKFSNIELIL